jgi:uncharacterized protein (TIGR02145 family)
MGKFYSILAFVILSFGSQLTAQTLKNIHRHNQPVLHIPTHLIDRVETADVNGERVLKVIQLNGYVSQIPVSQIDSITHSEGQAVDPAQLGNLRTASVMGVVRDTGNAPVNMAIVRSALSGEVTHTDANGVFFLNNITVYDKLGYITIEKPGYHKGSRSFLPLQQGSNRVNIELLPMALSGSFNSATGGQITSGLLQLTFPANAIQLNGQPYTGNVNVYAQALDPTSPEMFNQMPGELLGGMNDSLRLLRSYGMASIELRDANMNELQLANGMSATLTFSIPLSLQAEAPETIYWWSFDEFQGFWKHESEALKQGTQYVGLASHFSWWNCDVPENFNDIHGSVNSVDGNPISDALVNVVSLSMGSGSAYTNSEGEFSGRVPKNQFLTLNINLFCNSTNDWNLAHSEEFESLSELIEIDVISNLNGYYPITGTLVNCEGQPVESGYVKIGPLVCLTESGLFNIQTCLIGEFVIRGFDKSDPDSIKASAGDTIQVGAQGINIGELPACIEVYGIVSDIDGKLYPTVLIGSQWWMAENLSTATYANGTPIPNVTNNFTWGGLSTGAWCNYNNDPANDAVFGKLYNWFTTVDPSGLCPTDWHVPTDDEWTILSNELGGLSIAGGKMKSLNLWNAPNTDATNESGFSGLPGGMFNNANFIIGNFGLWFSSSENSSNLPWYRSLNLNHGGLTRDVTSKSVGFSIRCLKD